jgi:hypothetical protein
MGDGEGGVNGALDEAWVELLVPESPRGPAACQGLVAPEGALCTPEGFRPLPAPESQEARADAARGERGDGGAQAGEAGAGSPHEAGAGQAQSPVGGAEEEGNGCRLLPLLEYLSLERGAGEGGGLLAGAYVGAACRAACGSGGRAAGSLRAAENEPLEGAHRHLPDAETLAAARRAAECGGDPARAALLAELAAGQNPPDCARAVAAPLPHYGFAASFHYASLQLARGFRAGLAVSFPGPWLYAPASCGEEGSLACVFQPASLACHMQLDPDAEHPWGAALAAARAVPGAQAALDDGLFGCCGFANHPAVCPSPPPPPRGVQ